MHFSFQSFVGLSFIVAVLAMTEGCEPPSVCGPPVVDATSGVTVLTESSPAYRARLEGQNGVQPPHMACRAEATISLMIAAIDDPSRSDPGLGGGGYPAQTGPSSNPKSQGGLSQQQSVGYSVASDPHLHAGSHTAVTRQGQYRFLGVGRGTDRDDCGKAAIHACNDAVNGYFERARSVRTPDVVCQLNENQELCPRTKQGENLDRPGR